MTRKSSGVLALLLVGVSTIFGTQVAEAAECTSTDIRLGACQTVNGEVTDNAVILTGTQISGDENAHHGDSSAVQGGIGDDRTDAVPAADQAPLRDGYGVTSPVTLRDIASFIPSAGSDHMQPNGWMVVGLDTNFYAQAGAQIQDGMLLGEPASVRFTPRAYHWNYGDGTAATRSTPGATWAAQALKEFDRTATSHSYSKKGSYTITLTIDFGGEYRYAGSSWVRIAGTLPVPANPLTASAGDAKTVLVAKDCAARPSGPGC